MTADARALVVAGGAPGLAPDAVVATLQRVARSWGVALEIRQHEGRPRLSEDGTSTLLFVDPDQSVLFAAGQDAVTRVYGPPGVNAIATGGEFDIALRRNLDWQGAAGLSRLEALLVHELGHALGKAHSCELGFAGSVPTGAFLCRDAPAYRLNSVMYPDALAEGRALALVPTSWDLNGAQPGAVDGSRWGVAVVVIALSLAVASLVMRVSTRRRRA